MSTPELSTITDYAQAHGLRASDLMAVIAADPGLEHPAHFADPLRRLIQTSDGTYADALYPVEYLRQVAYSVAPRLIGVVTDTTPASLGYGTYRGPVEIDAQTGEWVHNKLPEAYLASFELGEPIDSVEYEDLHPVLVDAPKATLPPVPTTCEYEVAHSPCGAPAVIVRELEEQYSWVSYRLCAEHAAVDAANLGLGPDVLAKTDTAVGQP